MVELMAEYSPPMPQPVKKRNSEEGEAVPCESGHRRGDEVDDDGGEEEFLAAEPVGQPAEEQRADDGAEKIGAAGQADLGIRESQRRAFLQGWRDGARERDFEPIENPGDPQRHDDQNVETAPWQALEPRRNERRDLP